MFPLWIDLVLTSLPDLMLGLVATISLFVAFVAGSAGRI
jgi:hypothetical protein